MDKGLLDDLINTVIKDEKNTNTYDGLDVLLSSLSNDEVMYFIEGCGEKLFENDNLSTIMWNTHPLIFYDYICIYIDEKVKKIDEDLIEINERRSKNQIGENEFKSLINGFLAHKNQLTSLKNGFVSNIIHFVNTKK